MTRITYTSSPVRHFVRQINCVGSETATSTNPGVGVLSYSPIQVLFRCTVEGLLIYPGSTATGNVYVALYNRITWQPNILLATSASTALAGVDQEQYIPFPSPVTIDPEVYWGALESDQAADRFYISVTQSIAAFRTPANVNHGLRFFYEVLGGGVYTVPPATATPLICETNKGFFMRLRVASVP